MLPQVSKPRQTLHANLWKNKDTLKVFYGPKLGKEHAYSCLDAFNTIQVSNLDTFKAKQTQANPLTKLTTRYSPCRPHRSLVGFHGIIVLRWTCLHANLWLPKQLSYKLMQA